MEEHIRCENLHDLDGIMATFGEDARYDDEPWGRAPPGAGRGPLLLRRARHRPPRSPHRGAFPPPRRGDDRPGGPDHRHAPGPYRGLPPTGRRLRFPLCAVYTFTDEDKLAGERIYFDRATMLRQLGIFREPDTLPGRIATALAHPLTVIRTFLRRA